MQAAFLATSLLYTTSAAAYVAFLFRQDNRLQRWGRQAILAGFVCHSLMLLTESLRLGHIPAQNLPETLSIAGWSLAGVFLVFQYRFRLKVLGIIAAPLAAACTTSGLLLPGVPLKESAVLKSYWLSTHILSIFIAEAAFALACGIGILYLLQENAIKTKRRGFFFRRLPSLDLLDTTGYACIAIGFALLTFGLITGFVYAKAVWGRFWGWDPKEVWSGISWLLYAALLHQRLTVGWRGRKSALMAIAGFGILLFTFLGVNFLLQGHHGDFTRW
jgi:cytochrome c-type biogenesis protein CcsB